MSEPAVRRAAEDDIPSIRDLEEEAFGFTWDHQTFEKELTRDNGATVVLEFQGEVIGSALLVWAAEEVQLNSIVLHPTARGSGHSRPFLGRLMAWCRTEGFHWITLEVKWNNPPAHALYRGLGFVTTARRKAYYRDGQDARIMWAGDLRSAEFGELLDPYLGDGLQLRRVS